MQIHGIPVKLKLNSTVLMIASFIVSVLVGLILGFAGAGRGVYVMMYTVGMAYLKLLFLLALPLVFLNLVSGVMQRVQLQSDRSSPARLCFFHSIAVVGAAILGLAAGGITGSSMIPATFAGFADFGLRWLRPLVPWLLFLSVLCRNVMAADFARGSVFPALPHDWGPGSGCSVARSETGFGDGFLLCGVRRFGLRISAASLRQRLSDAFPAQL